jgi:hypothetical protein
MSLKTALIWWNKKGTIEDHDDTMFVAGYQKALEDAADMAEKSMGLRDTAMAIRRLDDVEMNMGN